jgi:deoxyribonuclease (pyrimidine dimer)
MTRINLISPIALTDQHLIAEYKEITQVHGSLTRTLNSKKGLDVNRISETCPLNGGHVYFFYNKLAYLKNRYLSLANEMMDRGFKPVAYMRNLDRISSYPQHLYNDYNPSNTEKELLKERIESRINNKRDWYKYRGNKLTPLYFEILRQSD